MLEAYPQWPTARLVETERSVDLVTRALRGEGIRAAAEPRGRPEGSGPGPPGRQRATAAGGHPTG